MGIEAAPGSPMHASRRIVICGSMAFYGAMYRLREELLEEGVQAIIPDAEDDLISAVSQEQYESIRRRYSLNHIRRIRNPRTYGVLVVNFDKHGIRDYIGPSSFAEIAIASAHGKRIFVLNEFPAVYEEELSLWNAQVLHGRLEAMVSLYRESCLRPVTQLNMFAA